MYTMAKARKTASNGPVDIRAEFRKLGILIEHGSDQFRAVREQYGSIQGTLAAHTEMIAKLAVDLTIVKEDIEFIKHGFKQKVDRDEFAALERRVALLERKR